MNLNQQYIPALSGANMYPDAVDKQEMMPAQRRLDITLRQNIDEQIKQAEANVELLKATKERMEKSGILDARIDDIQRAMRW